MTPFWSASHARHAPLVSCVAIQAAQRSRKALCASAGASRPARNSHRSSARRGASDETATRISVMEVVSRQPSVDSRQSTVLSRQSLAETVFGDQELFDDAARDQVLLADALEDRRIALPVPRA